MKQIQIKMSVSQDEIYKITRSAGVFYTFHEEEIQDYAETYDMDETNRVRAICPDFWTASTKLFFTLYYLRFHFDKDMLFYATFDNATIKLNYNDISFRNFIEFFEDGVEGFKDGLDYGKEILKKWGDIDL